jgi:hypothetical protein
MSVKIFSLTKIVQTTATNSLSFEKSLKLRILKLKLYILSSSSIDYLLSLSSL